MIIAFILFLLQIGIVCEVYKDVNADNHMAS